MVDHRNSFPILKKTYKGRYPFRLGTTSFIHPAGYADNVASIGPYVDEVELLFFESLGNDIGPLKMEVQQLARLSRELEVSYNVHLPSDVSPGHEDRHQRQIAVDALKRVIDLTAPLSPSTWTLHLPIQGGSLTFVDVDEWRDRTLQSVKALLDAGVEPGSLSVETLDYPFEMVEPVVLALDLGVCLDIGHCIVHDFDYASLFSRLHERITILHLHGVDGEKDHLPLDRLPQHHTAAILTLLNRFKGTVSLEMFSFEKLKTSLACLDKAWFKHES